LVRVKWKMFEEAFDALPIEDRGLVADRMGNLKEKAALVALEAQQKRAGEDILA